MIKQILFTSTLLAVSGLGFFGGIYYADRDNITNTTTSIGSTGTNNESSLTVNSDSAVIDVTTKVIPSVVSIITSQYSSSYFGDYNQQGAGTGTIINEDGLILTNRHVVKGSDELYIITNDGSQFEAEIIAVDNINDIAFIRSEGAKDYPKATLGDSKALQLGEAVVAIGNALGEFQNTVTTGIVSGFNRNIVATGGDLQAESLSNLIQTDASINSGNSGGPLFNLAGQVIGVNVAVSEAAENIGFSIPINDVKNLIVSVEKDGEIKRPFLGVTYSTITPIEANELSLENYVGAALVVGNEENPGVVEGSPADVAGLQIDDIIYEIAGIKLDISTSLGSAINSLSLGQEVDIKVSRDGEDITLNTVLVEFDF